ncbi:MAG: 4-(cytidine 5'-diphospho)-2-C-methyl-D-erythritol kinase [Solirubrobacteraceae bacterium]
MTATDLGLGVGLTTLAPAKVNVTLVVGPTRARDGRHELVSVMQSLSLADTVTLRRRREGDPAPPIADPHGDAVDCAGVDGDNLALQALRAFREATGWDAPPLTVVIAKRIPVAAGMAGGSADAGATLRLARTIQPLDDATLDRIAIGLGADVPHQLQPGLALAEGAGERLTRLPGRLPGAIVVLRAPFGLATADVYRRTDELGATRAADDLAGWRARISGALGIGVAPAGGRPESPLPPSHRPESPLPPSHRPEGPASGSERVGSGAALRADPPSHPLLPAALRVNDLQRAAIDLRPEVDDALDALRSVGGTGAMVSGSGPTTFAWFGDDASASRAAGRLRDAGHDVDVAHPVAGVPTPSGDLS